MPAMLTVERDPEGTPESYGSTCPDHPEHDREGLAQRHAMNVVAKHNRESHAEPVLNLSAAARMVRHASDGPARPEALAIWNSLTNLGATAGRDYLAAVLAEPEDVLVHIAPF
jgi:hypothetical protein